MSGIEIFGGALLAGSWFLKAAFKDRLRKGSLRRGMRRFLGDEGSHGAAFAIALAAKGAAAVGPFGEVAALAVEWVADPDDFSDDDDADEALSQADGHRRLLAGARPVLGVNDR